MIMPVPSPLVPLYHVSQGEYNELLACRQKESALEKEQRLIAEYFWRMADAADGKGAGVYAEHLRKKGDAAFVASDDAATGVWLLDRRLRGEDR